MGKGSGGGGGNKNAGGVGGRSGKRSSPLKTFLGYAGAYFLVGYAADAKFRETVNAVGKYAANRAAYSVLPVTKSMRDKVRRWSVERAAAAAGRAQGAINTEGVAVAAARAALSGGKAIGDIPTGAVAKSWRSIPDNSIIGMGPNGRAFRGSEIKSLVREAIAAGKNHVANAPQLEAYTGPRLADKARSLAANVPRPEKPRKSAAKQLAKARKAMKKK